MKRRMIGACCLIALAVAGCARGRNEAWVARAGDIVVGPAEAEAYAMLETQREFAKLSAENKRALLTKLLIRKTIAAAAEREGRAGDPAVARAQTAWKFENLPDLYWAETVEKDVQVSDEELRAVINPQARYLLSAMVFEDDAAGEREARKVHAKLQAGGDFAELAQEFSRGFSASRGGDMGWVEVPNQMIEEAEAALIAGLAPGAFSEPFRTRLGWTIFKLREKRDADFVFAEKKLQVLPQVRAAKIDEAKTKRLGELRARASIFYPADQPGAPAGAPAAIVNGFAFPADPQAGAAPAHGNVPRAVTPRRQQLEKSIATFLIVQDAERLGIPERPEHKVVLDLLRMDALAQLQLRARAESGAAVTDEEAREEHRRYFTPDTYVIKMIVVDKRERAEEARRRALAGEAFESLAAEFNTGLLAESRGEVPLSPTAAYPAAVQGVIRTLADGGLSDVLDMGEGKWGLVKRIATQAFTPPPFEQVESQIRRRLELRKRAEANQRLVEEYQAKTKVAFNEEFLSQP